LNGFVGFSEDVILNKYCENFAGDNFTIQQDFKKDFFCGCFI